MVGIARRTGTPQATWVGDGCIDKSALQKSAVDVDGELANDTELRSGSEADGGEPRRVKRVVARAGVGCTHIHVHCVFVDGAVQTAQAVGCDVLVGACGISQGN